MWSLLREAAAAVTVEGSRAAPAESLGVEAALEVVPASLAVGRASLAPLVDLVALVASRARVSEMCTYERTWFSHA